MINNELLKILICPLTHEPLFLKDNKLVNKKWGIKYPIRNGIPLLLIEQAELHENADTIEEIKAKLSANNIYVKV